MRDLMKKWLMSVVLMVVTSAAFAGHIAGGEVYYRLIGPGTTTGTNEYEITLRLFRECNPPAGSQPTAPMPTEVWLGVFNNTNPSSQYGQTLIVNRTKFETISLTPNTNPCIVNPPEVCYQVAYFTVTVTLPVSAFGYTVSFQSCCRTNGIQNLPAGASQGATYVADIPGTAAITTAVNSSAVFSVKDTTLVCKNSPFTLDFSATDPDGDSLVYSFCDAYNGGPTGNSTNVTPSNPPYGFINYETSSYSGTEPLGSNVSINSKTGIISGIAPNAGSYVVNVCIAEYRNGMLISTHRKDFTLKVGNCSLTSAELKPSYTNCKTFDFTFQNESTSSTISAYLWNFGDPNSGVNNTSTLPVAPHIFSDTGIYTVKLKVVNTGGCQDSATTQIRVYPGFTPKFNVVGSCYQTPFQFFDQSTANYGAVNKWKWDFGETGSNADTSNIKNPVYQYPAPGTRTVTLVVGSSKGCVDTAKVTVNVTDKPLLQLPFKDTLICSVDTLPLKAIVSNVATVKWNPSVNISNTNIPNPLVWPKDTALYIITVTEGTCVNKDTIKVNVLDFITVDITPADTGICKTDSIVLRPVSHALSYQWTPALGLSDAAVKYPKASPASTMKYYVTANLGKCQDKDSIRIRVTPYPQATINAVDTLCFGDSVKLQATIVGASFVWSPVTTLRNISTLSPVAKPDSTTKYILTVYDTIGCPKPFRDTITVPVLPPVDAYAGEDTTIVVGQSLQLFGSGGSFYQWVPATGLNNSNIFNPIALFNAGPDSIRYRLKVTTTAGCVGYDEIVVRLFKTQPDIFIPTGFTPNNDGLNDVLKAIPVGIQKFEFFKIFNRWGQMLFTTSDPQKGWDGLLNGTQQPSGTYVFMAQGIDYLGKPVFKKGTVVLIR